MDLDSVLKIFRDVNQRAAESYFAKNIHLVEDKAKFLKG